MSSTFVTYPMVGCTSIAAERLGFAEWEAINDQQLNFLMDFFPDRIELSNIPDIESIADVNVETVNKFLADNNFDIQIDDLGADGALYVASILDVLLKWVKEGTRTKIESEGRQYDAVLLKGNMNFFTSCESPSPVVCVRTQTADTLFMTMIDCSHYRRHDLGLVYRAMAIRNTLTSASGFCGIQFPMVKYDNQVDIAWFHGMRGEGSLYRIEQALQQTRFRMNEFGTRAESSVAMGLLRCVTPKPKPIHIIDKPFLVWIERPGLSSPLFVGWMTEENWQDPGSLG